MKSNALIKAWKTISSSVVFEANPWLKIIQDTVELPNKRIVDDYYRIETQDYVLIYAKSNEGKVLVERQYKHGLGKTTITFPAGFIDKDEKPLHAAQRELLQEHGNISALLFLMVPAIMGRHITLLPKVWII
jgi:ADP-ribose pyrophosphatase